MTSREECIAHIIDMQNGGAPMELRPGMRVEHHADCNLIDSECEWSPCEIVRHDKDGWWFAQFGDGHECLIHAIECLPIREVPESGPILDALSELRDASGGRWEQVDPDEFLRNERDQ